MDKTLYLLRHIPGAGATTLAKRLSVAFCCDYYEADDFFVRGGEYEFNPAYLKQAHAECAENVESDMKEGKENIIVSNTFTTEREMENYFLLAKTYDYNVVSLVVENRHGGNDVHHVPVEAKKRMCQRFQLRLN